MFYEYVKLQPTMFTRILDRCARLPESASEKPQVNRGNDRIDEAHGDERKYVLNVNLVSW